MGFTQITFLFAYLPISIIFYLAVCKISKGNLRVCNVVLVCESLLFFLWAEPKLLVFFIISTILTYLMGERLHAARKIREKKQLMIISVIVFAALPILYYYIPSLNIATESSQPLDMPALIPLGISFFALEAISYIVDIYTCKALPGNFIKVFVYMMLFPKAVCGPVILWRDFGPQTEKRKISINNVGNGLKRIIIGYAKKAILADTFAASIALIEAKMSTNSTGSGAIWLLGLLYFFRIYYDFSGYSDIAIGLCNVFGFEIAENFNKPYLSASLTEFWRRWHISFGSWLREYVYIPLGGNRYGKQYLNLLITFFIAGLWHGWRDAVLLWAVINGLIVIAEKNVYKKEWYQSIPKWVRILCTLIIVFFGWLLFRSPSIKAAGSVFKALLISPAGSEPNFTWRFFMTRRTAVFLVIAASGAIGLFDKLGKLLKSKTNDITYDLFEKTVLLILFAVSIMFVIGGEYIPFIYSLI